MALADRLIAAHHTYPHRNETVNNSLVIDESELANPRQDKVGAIYGEDAVAGCTLHVPPDVLELLPVAHGVASANWLLPNLPGLAGARFHHQMIVLQAEPGSPIAAVFVSDAIELTIGAF